MTKIEEKAKEWIKSEKTLEQCGDVNIFLGQLGSIKLSKLLSSFAESLLEEREKQAFEAGIKSAYLIIKKSLNTENVGMFYKSFKEQTLNE